MPRQPRNAFNRVAGGFSPPSPQSSSAGESHPHALTEPDVNLSVHPALIAQPVPEEIASEQTVSVASAVFALAIDMLYAGVSSVSCISS